MRISIKFATLYRVTCFQCKPFRELDFDTERNVFKGNVNRAAITARSEYIIQHEIVITKQNIYIYDKVQICRRMSNFHFIIL